MLGLCASFVVCCRGVPTRRAQRAVPALPLHTMSFQTRLDTVDAWQREVRTADALGYQGYLHV